jgi:GTP-binding protein Era
MVGIPALKPLNSGVPGRSLGLVLKRGSVGNGGDRRIWRGGRAPRHACASSASSASSANDDSLSEMFEPGLTSAPDYSDYITFEEDPPGHRSGFVAIVGRPNAGKSTLLNALLGQPLSIVTPKAQTTRHRVLGVWSESGHQAIFLDTPGIIANRRDELEERMMGAVEGAVADGDVLLVIVDASSRVPESIIEMLQPSLSPSGPPLAIIINKIDLVPQSKADELTSLFSDCASHINLKTVIPISALNGDNVKKLSEWVVQQLPEGPSLYPKDVVAEAPERFFVSEIIRRQVFLQYRQELPYQVAVEVTEFKERQAPAKSLIRANVLVDKKRHVGLLLGAGGAAIKELSMASRKEIEEFLDKSVYLDISVKVAEKWRKDAKQLDRLGH